jgi:hypothetical protein
MTSSMLTGMRTVFIPASLRLSTSSWVNHVDLKRYHQKRYKDTRWMIIPVDRESLVYYIAGISGRERTIEMSS